MSSKLNVFVFTFFMFIHSGIIINVNADTFTERFVPLGHNFNFSCGAYENLKYQYLEIISVQWFFRCVRDSINLINETNSTFLWDKEHYFLLGHDIQRHNEGIYECRVSYSNLFTNESSAESSLILLKVQDCNENIDSNSSHALRNPCQFGQCRVSKLEGGKREKLYCDCVEQFTGLFCDVQKTGTWWREVLYYSSTFGHFLCTGIIFLCFYCFDRANSMERISLQEDVPDFGRFHDNPDTLYPAARIDSSPQQRPPSFQPQQSQPQAAAADSRDDIHTDVTQRSTSISAAITKRVNPTNPEVATTNPKVQQPTAATTTTQSQNPTNAAVPKTSRTKRTRPTNPRPSETIIKLRNPTKADVATTTQP